VRLQRGLTELDSHLIHCAKLNPPPPTLSTHLLCNRRSGISATLQTVRPRANLIDVRWADLDESQSHSPR